MSILERIRRIARANVHDLLDKVDTPEMEVQSKIDELQKALGEARRALAGFAATHKRLESDHRHLEQTVKDLASKAEDALRSGDESAAREAIVEKVKTEARRSRLAPAVARSEATYKEMKDTLVSLNDQLKAARLKMAELQSRKRAAEARQAMGEKFEKARTAAEAGGGFERLEDEVLEAETDVEIQEEIRAELSGAEPQAETESVDSQVEDELAALKQKIEGSG